MRTRLFLFALCVHSLVWAVTEPASDKKAGTSIIGSTLLVEGSRYQTSSVTPVASHTYWTQGATGLVKLSYTAMSAPNRPTGTATVALSITYYVEENGSFGLPITMTKTLALTLGANVSTDVAYVKIEGAQKMTVQVLPAASGTNIPTTWTALELDASIKTESFSLLERNAISGTTLSHQSTLTSDGNLLVNWTALAGAESYELEWTYVSDHDGINKTERKLASAIEVDRFLFRNNSSRTEVKGLSYAIPMIYEQGVILYRLRAVGKNVMNSVPVLAKTEWTSPDGLYGTVGEYPVANRFVFDGLEEKLNWQSSLSFAEEGKHKVVVSYHDGSARNRQAVTRINTDQRAIIGETFYDYNGRPAIQVLPVPVTNNKILYTPHFNLKEGTTSFDKEDIDGAKEGAGCGPVSPAFSTGIGASNYYSPSNSFGTVGNTGSNILNKHLIPDAQKYPYTQTYYTPDNTGRIAAQSGVGSTHRIGTGYETRYFYGAPQQEELTRLFGNQVGIAGHYKKNAVVDPNKQTSVSYIDMSGKVVATALAGGSPTNVDALTGNNQRTIESNLLASDEVSNLLSSDKLSKVYNTKFTVSGANTEYNFDYGATVSKYQITCSRSQSSNPVNYSIDGVVDVELKLLDKCGLLIFEEKRNSNLGYTGVNQTLPPLKKSTTLQPGEYQLVKTLKINEEKLDIYWNDYLSKEGTCVLTDKNYSDDELAKINTIGCGLKCSDCQAQVTNLLANANYLSQEERERIQGLCDDLCENNPVNCRGSLEAMRGDVSPGGQYGQLRKDKISSPALPEAKLDENNQPVQPVLDIKLNSTDKSGNGFDAGDPADDIINARDFPLSVFNDETNRLKKYGFLGTDQKPSWRSPLQISKTGFTKSNFANQLLFDNSLNLKGATYQITDYKDKNGDVFYVDVFKVKRDDNTFYYKPEIAAGKETELVEVDIEAGLYKLPVRHLKNLADFEKFWQNNWANYLIPYHPEYPYLVECTSDQTSQSFDYLLMDANTIDLAKSAELDLVSAAGAPKILGTSIATCKDPFLASSAARYNQFKAKYDNYANFGIQGGVASMRNMPTMATITVGCPRGQTNCGAPGCLDGVIDTDDEWNAFKAFYLAEKQKMVRDKALITAVDGEYYNGCIGHKEYIYLPEASYFRRQINFQQEYGATRRECWREWYDIFNWNEKCVDVSYTAYRDATTYPYLNPNQLCYTGSGADYEKKTQRFFPAIPTSIAGSQVPQRCTTLVYTDNPAPRDIVEVSVACEADLQEAANVAVLEAQRFKYESCGLCPLASDVEQLMIDMRADKALFPATPILLSCDLDVYNVKLGEVIRRELLPGAALNPEVYWSSSLSTGNKLLQGRFYKVENGIQTELATLSLRIPDLVPETFLTLSKLCCLTLLKTSSTYFTFEEGKNFTMNSSYINNNNSVDFLVEGKISLPLSPCSIAPRCLMTDDVYNLGLFLNTLCISETNLNNKNHDLSTSNTVRALTSKDFYNDAVRKLINKDNKDANKGYIFDPIAVTGPSWSSQIVSGVLKGQFSCVIPASEMLSNTAKIIAYDVEIRDFPATYQFSDIKQFSNFKPEAIDMMSTDVCRTMPCEKKTFKADAELIINDQKIFVPVTFYVPELKPVICKPALPPTK